MTTAIRDAAWAFAAYETVRERLPSASFEGIEPSTARDLSDAAQGADLVLLDAYGVLNVGESPVPGAVDRVAALRNAGKSVKVVSNSAGYPKRVMMNRWRRLGFDFTTDEVVSSRDTALAYASSMSGVRWGVIASTAYGSEELEGIEHELLDDEVGWDADAFLFLGSEGWDEARQARLESALADQPRPLLIGNPDIVAPREGGLSLEPGYWAHRLADRGAVVPTFLGKPFSPVFDRALADTGLSPDRVVMVGDTLHTDILGGRAIAVQTVLVTGHGSLAGMNVEAAIAKSGIAPHRIVHSI